MLIADDNETSRGILTHQLTTWGMQAEAVASGPEALRLVADGRKFDLALLDMRLPERDATTLAAEMSKSAGEPTLLILMSSGNRREIIDRNPEALFAGFVAKPIKRSQLLDTLTASLRGKTSPTNRAPGAGSVSHMAERMPLRILLAEDNRINQKVALKILESLGYRADVTGNGREALEALQRQPYDVVILDVHMPEMDGLEASRRICSTWPMEKRPRIIAMTANAIQGDREECLAAGMDDYVSKPVRVAELADALERAWHVISLRRCA